MRPIVYNKLTKEEWLSYYMPGTIRVLHNKYQFFWSGLYHSISANSIEEYLSKKNDSFKHKMVLYLLGNYDNRYYFFFVVYRKDRIDVYYLDPKDNYIHSQGQVNYFIKKWKKYYDEEDEWYGYEIPEDNVEEELKEELW